MRWFDVIVAMIGAALYAAATCAFAYALYSHWLGPGFDFGPAFIAVAALVYIAPAQIAVVRLHRDRMAIIALNLLLGATGLGWIGALLWALTGNVEVPTSDVGSSPARAPHPAEDAMAEAARNAGASMGRGVLKWLSKRV